MLDVYKSQKLMNSINSNNNNNTVNGNSSVINLKPIQTNSKKLNSKKKKKKANVIASENVVTSTTTATKEIIENTKQPIPNSNKNTTNKQSSLESISLMEMTSSIHTIDSSQNTRLRSRNQSLEIKSLDGFSSSNSLRRLDEQYNEKDLLSNPSLRWHNQTDNENEEKVRIELYKLNRRKRYIEQRNRFFLPPIF
jgi:hypothetical protein